MMRSATHGLIILLIGSMVPVLLVLKILQRYRELFGPGQPPPPSHPFLAAIGRGIAGRLDDPSFWNIVGTTLAATLVALAVAAVDLKAPAEVRPRWKLRHLLSWAVAFAGLAGAYLLLTGLVTHEALFTPRLVERTVAGAKVHVPIDGTVLLIQRVEGALLLLVVLLGTAFLPIGLTCLDYLVSRIHQATAATDVPEVLPACTFLRSAGKGPVSVTIICSVLWKFLTPLLGLTPSFLGAGLKALGTVGFLLIFYAPFLYLSSRTSRQLKKKVLFESKKFKLPEDVEDILVVAMLPALSLGSFYVARKFDDDAFPPHARPAQPAEGEQ